MTDTDRKRLTSLGLILAVGALALDRLALTPYLERRKTLADLAQTRQRDLADADQVLRRQRDIRRTLARMPGLARSDASAAEGNLLRHLSDWQQQAGIGKASFQRVRATDAHGLGQLTFQVSASGPMPALAALVYRFEAAPIPLRIDELHVSARREGAGDDLQLQATVTTLFRTADAPPPPARPGPNDVAALADNGGRP